MKFSVILMSLTLPIAAQSAAQAEDAGSSTANFLKSSISANESAAPKRAKLQLSDQRAEAQTLASSTVKLRPFVPNRKLPRQRDIDYQLMAQTARMAAAPAPLSGQISEFAAGTQPMAAPFEIDTGRINRAIATYDSATLAKAWAPRVVPGQTATMPGQVRVNRQGRSRVANRASSNPEWFSQAGSGERVIGQGAGLLVQAPAMAPSEQIVNERMAELGYPSTSEIAGTAPTGNIPQEIIRPASLEGSEQGATAGPAPFPLNMLPQDQLKDFIKARARNRIQAPKAYFGSWHGEGAHNLPTAGFHSNIHSKGFSTGSYSPPQPRIAMNQPPTKPAASRTTQVSQLRNRSNQQQPNRIAQPNRLSQQAVQVATYAPYSMQPHTGTD
jgi:hypothetical protein